MSIVRSSKFKKRVSLFLVLTMLLGVLPNWNIMLIQAAKENKAETPKASPDSGGVPPGTIIRLTTASAGADIIYTVDGTNPTTSSQAMVYTDDSVISVDADMTLKAYATGSDYFDSDIAVYTYTINQYTVTYQSNGGSAVSPAFGTVGKLLSKPIDPVYPHYILDGWYKDEACTDQWNFTTDTMPAKNITLYAKWHTNGQAEKPTASVKSGPVPPGTIVTLSTISTDAIILYTTDGTDPSIYSSSTLAYTSHTIISINGNLTLKALTMGTGYTDSEIVTYTYTSNQFTVTYQSNGGSPVATATATSGALLTKPFDPTYQGFGFDGWYKEESCINKWDFTKDTMPSNNMTLYAKWHKLDKASPPTASINSGGVPQGTTLKLTTLSQDATILYTTDGTDPAITSPSTLAYTDGTVISINKNLTLKAMTVGPNYINSDIATYDYFINQFIVTYQSNGGSAVGSTFATTGTLLTKPSNPIYPGYGFDGWFKEALCINQWDFTKDTMPANNITLYAKWHQIKKAATPIASVNPGGVVSGTTVKLSTLSSGALILYTTDGTDPSASSPTTLVYTSSTVISVTGNLTLKAMATGSGYINSDIAVFTYTINQFTVTFQTNGGSAIAPTNVAVGALLPKPSDPTHPGYMFNGWCKNPACTIEWNFSTDTVTADTTIYAYWTPIPVIFNDATITVGMGSAFAGLVKATGGSGSFTYSVTGGILPVGMTLSNSGVLSGTTMALGSYPLTITATDINNGLTDTAIITISVIQYHKADTPKASISSGSVTLGTNVSLTSASTGVTILYTLDGTDPSTSSSTTLAYTDSKIISVTGNMTLKAITVGSGYMNSDIATYTYYISRFTVTYQSNGGTTITSDTVATGVMLTKPTDPTYSDHVFGGWYKDSACTKQWNFTKDTMGLENIILYAKWYLLGDINMDGTVDILDVRIGMLYTVGGVTLTDLQIKIGDINNDQQLDVLDMKMLLLKV